MKALTRTAMAVGLFAAAFLLVNAYIYSEKQAELAPAPQDGEHLGFIRALTDDDTALYFDEAVWLTGAAAEDAAIAAGLCTEETRAECTPNDFFIKNDDATEARLPVRNDARVTLLTYRMEETGSVTARTVDIGTFSDLVNDPALHWSSLPYEIVVSQGDIVSIQEVYVP